MTEQEALYKLISDISERCWHAGWMDGVEFYLWALITKQIITIEDRQYGIDIISEKEVNELKTLSKEVKGWFTFDEEKVQIVFIDLEDWEKLFHDNINLSLLFKE